MSKVRARPKNFGQSLLWKTSADQGTSRLSRTISHRLIDWATSLSVVRNVCARGLNTRSRLVTIMFGTSQVGSSIGRARSRLDRGMKCSTDRGMSVTQRPVASRRSRKLMESDRRRGMGISTPAASNARPSGDRASASGSDVIQDSSFNSAKVMRRRLACRCSALTTTRN